MDLDVSTAIPLALIVNELVTNSYKHAFNKSNEGAIEIYLIENNKKVFLRIKDSGPGYDFSNASDSSIGLDIIHGLIDQINGTLTYDNQAGSTYDISFTKSWLKHENTMNTQEIFHPIYPSIYLTIY